MARFNPTPFVAALTLGVAPVLAFATAVPSGSAPQSGAPAMTMPVAGGTMSKVVVILRDQAAHLPAHSAARLAALHSEERPLARLLSAAGATVERTGTAIPYVVASVSNAQKAALAANPLVQVIVPNTMIHLAPPVLPPTASAPTLAGAGSSSSPDAVDPPSICGTAEHPEVDPEAITASAINSVGANALGYDGAGVTVAYIAGEIDPTIADFQRNSLWASSGSPTGSAVVQPVNFTGDPSTAPGGDAAVESFLDASSIAAQGNTVYDLNNFVNSGHLLPQSPCDITITGAAPGANVLGLDVFSSDYDTTESNFIQAIDYAVSHGVKVINESFGANNFPDTMLDATRIADDDAVAAGVTVVASSGDAGPGSTIGSPATDPNVISAGASTTFRSYLQNTFGGINATSPNSNNGNWIDNNVSSLSSSGFSMSGGNTVDILAPGDLNWAECSTSPQFANCTNENGAPSPIGQSGGTSESSPLTAGAAADVIQAYASTHGGTDPSPALVKQILMSTATDVAAPAEEQGAGLLNVLAAVKEAISLPGTTATPQGGLLIGPNQINIVQNPGATTSQQIHITNTSSNPVTVNLSTRALTHQVASTTSSFCLNPSSSSTGACGPPTSNTFPIWSGVTEVYQEETFPVPATTSPSRLDFVADYPTDSPPQSSLLHVALFDPTGAYAGYSLPQGLGDYAHIEVANPAAGTWTAVFFTEQDGATGPGSTGTSGTIQYQATTWEYASAGSISPSTLTIGPGKTATATFSASSSSVAGDAAQSIVLAPVGGSGDNTIPVTVRTLVQTSRGGGNFSGVLSGGNGRAGAPANTSTYAFTIPKGLDDLDVSAAFAEVNDVLAGYLIDPSGQAVAQSSNLTLDGSGNPLFTGNVNLYKDNPQPGRWEVVFDWLQPVSGSELAEPFQGAVRFNQVSVTSNLPRNPSSHLAQGHSYTFDVTVSNTGLAPEAFFIDPRTSHTAPVRLPDLNGSDQNMSLPLPPGLSFPLYFVPNDTTGIIATLSGTAPVTFDVEAFPGDPDLSPALPAPGIIENQSGDSASLTYRSPSNEVMSGLWLLNPSEIGPYASSSGAPSVTASASFSAITETFDPTVTSPTGDLWALDPPLFTGPNGFSPVYVDPGATATIPVTITPTAPVGTKVSGFVNLDDTYLLNAAVGLTDSGGDELTSIRYTYRVTSP